MWCTTSWCARCGAGFLTGLLIDGLKHAHVAQPYTASIVVGQAFGALGVLPLWAAARSWHQEQGPHLPLLST